MRPLSSAKWFWPTLAVVVSCLPFLGAFSLTNIFYIRDLTMFFWPRHLWIHRSLMTGSWPLWDPYAAAGQPVASDALNQLFLPPVMLFRVLPSILGFNLLVATPFPLAALGMWLFLRRHLSSASAAFGAMLFAVSGPVVSTGNFPNLSWSVAWMPWIVWAADRDRAAPSARGFALLAAIIALQMLSGEPVTMAGTLVFLVAYALASADSARVRTAVRVVGAISVAAMIAAVQMIPMALAARQSPRALMVTDNFWSVHPLWLVEAVLPHVFGNTFTQYESQLPWIHPLNSGRDPFFYSLSVGLLALLLSVLGTFCGRPRWRFFWSGVVVAGVVLAFGQYSAVYPIVQRLVPPVRSFRFPAKFLLFASFGVAVLAATAADALQGRDSASRSPLVTPSAVKVTCGIAAAAALALAFAIGLVLIAPFTGARWFYDLGKVVGVADPVAGAAFLFSAMPPIATRELVLLMTAAILVYVGWGGGRRITLARALFFALAIGELAAATVDLNPTLPAVRLGPPSWTATLAPHPEDRFYFGGKFRGSLATDDADLQGVQWRALEGVTVAEGHALMMGNLAMTPAAWGVRELLSYDLPQLWPVAHARAVRLFERADKAGRMRFLANGGVRYCLQAAPPWPGAPPLHPVGAQFGTMAVYDCVPGAARAAVVPTAVVVPEVTTQLAALFDESFDPASAVMVERLPPVAVGSPSAPATASARITTDSDQEVAVDAAAGTGGGYLLLRDSFDAAWRAAVDGQPAPLLRANGLFRAVRIPQGSHTVRFSYRPTTLFACALVSALTTLTLMWVAVRRSG